jgi:hypothetical protein
MKLQLGTIHIVRRRPSHIEPRASSDAPNRYKALRVPLEYVMEAMNRLRERG